MFVLFFWNNAFLLFAPLMEPSYAIKQNQKTIHIVWGIKFVREKKKHIRLYSHTTHILCLRWSCYKFDVTFRCRFVYCLENNGCIMAVWWTYCAWSPSTAATELRNRTNRQNPTDGLRNDETFSMNGNNLNVLTNDIIIAAVKVTEH